MPTIVLNVKQKQELEQAKAAFKSAQDRPTAKKQQKKLKPRIVRPKSEKSIADYAIEMLLEARAEQKQTTDIGIYGNTFVPVIDANTSVECIRRSISKALTYIRNPLNAYRPPIWMSKLPLVVIQERRGYGIYTI